MGAAITWEQLDGASTALTIGDRVLLGPDQEVDQDHWLFRWLAENFPSLGEIGSFILHNPVGRFTGWLREKIANIKAWSQTQITSLFLGVKTFVQYFDWNASDEDLDRLLEAQWRTLNSQLGGALGCTAGWAVGTALGLGLNLTVNFGVAAIFRLLKLPIVTFDLGLIRRALQGTLSEALDELSAQWGAFFRSAILYMARWSLIGIFKSVRRGLKLLNKYTPLLRLLGLDETVEKWGADDGEPWIISEKLEDAVAQIPHAGMRAFVDNFLEELDECSTEAAFVYAASIDRLRQEQLDTREAVLGVQKTVEIQPDREAPDEKIVMSGRDQVLRGAITNTLATYSQIHNRDVGQVVGEPLHEAMLNKSLDSTLSLALRWSPRQQPPFTRSQWELDGFDPTHWTEPEFTLPWVAPAKLDWDKIKFAMGGADGFISGPIRCAAYIGWPDRGLAGRQVVVFASTQAEGKRMLERLAELSQGDVYGFKYSQRERDPNNRQLTYKYNVRVYPRKATVTSQRREIDKEKGRGKLTGNWSPRRESIDMWLPGADVGVTEILQELRRWHTPIPF